MDQYNMLIIGGTKSTFLIDPEPITGEEMVLNLDVDAGTFSQARRRNENQGDPEPSNLLFNSAFKINSEHVAVLWFERKLREDGLTIQAREVKVSVFNCMQATWSHILLKEPLPFFFRATVIPLFTDHEDGDASLAKILILGGKPIGLSGKEEDQKLRIVELTT